MWSGIDQMLSTLTNVALGFIVVSAVSPEAFGGFSVAFLTYVLVLGLSSSIASDPLVVIHASDAARSLRCAAKQATGSALLIGAAVGLPLSVTGAAIGGAVGESLVPMSVFLPGLLLQDNIRHVFFARKTPRSAVMNDAIWTLFQGVGFLAAYAGPGKPSAGVLVSVWGLSASGAGLLGLIQSALLPSPSHLLLWWRSTRHLAKPFALDFLCRQGASQIGMYSVGVVAGLGALGSLRGAMLVMGPISILTASVRIFVLPEGARLRDRSYDQLARAAVLVAVLLAVAAVAWIIVIAALPDRIGSVLLGASWPAAKQVLPAIAVVTTAGALAASPLFGLRILGDGRRLVRARLIDAPLTVSGLLVGGVLGQAIGAAVGWAIANVLSAGVWWFYFVTSHAAGRHAKSQWGELAPYAPPQSDVAAPSESMPGPRPLP
jgi:O-antigen/teichoic acid export membrane protein